MIKVIKRDGRTKVFDKRFIQVAVSRAECDVRQEDTDLGLRIAQLVEESLVKDNINEIGIEDIQDLVLNFLNKEDKEVAKAYKEFRDGRELERTKRSKKERFYDEVLNCSNVDNDNANVDQYSFSGRKYRIADYEQKQYALRNLISKEGKKAFEEGLIYYHDLSSYAIGEHNCLNLDIKSGLDNGFTTRNGDVRPANSYSTACQLVAVMFQCQSQTQYGGVGANVFDYSLEEYVKKSFRKHYIEGLVFLENYTEEDCELELGKEELLSIDDEYYKTVSKKVYNYATKMLEKEGKQATEGLFHNLNTLESRAGSQLPFTSINLGRNTTPEGRLINKWVFNASLNGIGKLNKTSIFPISIFQYKKGVNAKPSDPNYDIKKLAIKSLSKRIYPNIVNCDWKQNIEEADNPNTYMSTMGCVDGQEVITYKLNKKLYVESFERMWNRLSNMFEVKEQEVKGNYFIDLIDVLIYDTKNGFVKCKRIIKNKDKGDWNRIKFSNGRSLLTTSDHPLPIINKGRTYVKDVNIGDEIFISQSQYSEELINEDIDKAWLLGFILCDGCYDNQLSSTIAIDSENDIEDRYKNIFSKLYNKNVETVEWYRGKKGNYKELKVNNGAYIQKELLNIFEGLQKINRHIPNEVFSWSRESKLSFLAGMIDADGYINTQKNKGSVVQLGSTNKELALQTMLLSQSLGLPTKVYLNHYTSKDRNKIRYRVEFTATLELLNYMSCSKKINNFVRESNISKTNRATVIEIESLGFLNKYSYDVTTESDYFEVSGVYSHNCRTMIGYDVHTDSYTKTGRGNLSPITIILPKLGLDYGIKLGKRNKADIEGFYKQLDKTLDLVKEELIIRYEYMCNQSPKSAPFIYNNTLMMGAEKCKGAENVRECLKHGTNAIGILGMAECCNAMFGKHHGESIEAYEFALGVVRYIYNYCKKISETYNMNFSQYFTPAEGLCKTSVDTLKLYYGEVEGVTDRKYLTNSIHIPVYYQLDAYTKLTLEAPFTQYGTGGCISYVEMDNNAIHNEEGLEKLIDYAMDLNIPYLAINFPINTCLDCGEVYNTDEDNCPTCGSDNVEKLKRVTGYITGNYKTAFNEGKKQEAEQRVVHTIFNPQTIPVLKQAYKELKDMEIMTFNEI